MRQWLKKSSYLLELIGFIVFGALLKGLPVEIASTLNGWLWRWFAPLTRRHQRALGHLAEAMPELNGARRRAIILDMWENLGRTFAESFHLREIVEGGRLQLADEEKWRARAGSSAGWMVCSAHLANWEIAVAALGRVGLGAAGVYQKLSNPLVDARVRAMRGFLYPAGLFPKGTTTALKLVRLVRSGAAAAVLADQRDESGVPVPFFGAPAPSMTFPALVARRFGAPLIVGRVRRRPGVRFEIEMIEIAVPHSADADSDVRAATAAIQSQIEEWIRQTPGEWMWAHRRWG